MPRTPSAVVASSAALSVALIVLLFVLDKREPFLYEPIGKVGYIVLFCIPHLASIVTLSFSTPRAFKFAKWLAILVLVPLVPYALFLGLFAGWAYYPLLYALMVLLILAQVAILWGASRASRS